MTRLREALRVIKALWSATKEQPASFQGEIFSLKNAWLGLTPVQIPHPPSTSGDTGRR